MKDAQFLAKSRKAKIPTTGMHRVFRGLKFESDAELVKKGASFTSHRGFTLVELLVAMVLLSMVTLVVAMALRMSIRAWERGVEEGEHLQRRVAIPSLMEKQLGALVKKDPFDSGQGKHRGRRENPRGSASCPVWMRHGP